MRLWALKCQSDKVSYKQANKKISPSIFLDILADSFYML
jgi:hypothetical protein